MSVLHIKMVDFHTKITHRGQGRPMMGPSLKVTFGQWRLRLKGGLFPKTPQTELLALKIWGKHKKTKGAGGIRTLNHQVQKPHPRPLSHRTSY